MDKILELIPTGELGIIEFFFSTIFSLLSGYVVMIIYNIYFSRSLDRNESLAKSFLIIAPSITGIFWAIQYSLPLSLGLLGALSFVRFRTPIKRAEDIGFILLLISIALLSSVYRFIAAGLLLGIISITLIITSFISSGRLPIFSIGKPITIFITTKKISPEYIRNKMTELLKSKFTKLNDKNIRIEDISPYEEGFQMRFSIYFPDYKDKYITQIYEEANEINGVLKLEIFNDQNNIV